jgi:hypothetical protein
MRNLIIVAVHRWKIYRINLIQGHVNQLNYNNYLDAVTLLFTCLLLLNILSYLTQMLPFNHPC